MTPEQTGSPARSGRASVATAVLAGVGVAIALAWAYWPILKIMAERWTYDPRYAHGYLVPAFSAALLWLRRDRLAGVTLRLSWWGVLLVACGAVLRVAAAYAYNDWLDAVSMIVTMAGAFALIGGPRALRWAWPAVAFLLFMVPLPFRLEMAMGWPLQRIATIASTYALQTLGFAAIGTGNVIQMAHSQIGVVEACSGLSMMLLFFALATGVAILMDRPLLDKLVVVASAVPIALLVNIVRITVTGVLRETVGERISSVVYHDLAGFLMIPLALLLLGLELWFLARAFVVVEEGGRRPAFSLADGISAGPPESDGRRRSRREGPVAPIVDRRGDGRP